MFAKFAVGLAKIALPIVVVIVAGYLVYAYVTGLFPFSGTGDGDIEGGTPAHELIEEEVIVIDEPPSLIIEISGNQIMYNDEVISLEQLEEVLRRYATVADIWELHDVYRAERATYESVRELLRRHDVVFRER